MFRSPHKKYKLRFGQAGYIGYGLVISLVVIFSLVVFKSSGGHALSPTTSIATAGGLCLDDHHSDLKQGAVVDIWGCNSTAAQDWTVKPTGILRGADYCLSVPSGSRSHGAKLVLDACDNGPGQVWLRQNDGFLNPDSGLCLAAPNNKAATQAVLGSCGQTAWQTSSASAGATQTNCARALKGEKIACYAALEWNKWQSPTADHSALLNTYTDGAPYEEWCADFVSYVYKEAGYPFTGGETDGWDENNANNIQNMGFTLHDASSYTPKPGDVAYFDYQGGHVEIVLSGGKKPTFIYGNSATIDPATGNGQMETNTITSDGWQGRVIYYLSPDI